MDDLTCICRNPNKFRDIAAVAACFSEKCGEEEVRRAREVIAVAEGACGGSGVRGAAAAGVRRKGGVRWRWWVALGVVVVGMVGGV